MGCIDGSQVRGRGSAGPWQASLGPASGASRHVWSTRWVVSRTTSTRAGHSDSCESARVRVAREDGGECAWPAGHTLGRWVHWADGLARRGAHGPDNLRSQSCNRAVTLSA
eukprot:scaffold103634_cov65-Phaeocystis_antarctica.AAC.1